MRLLLPKQGFFRFCQLEGSLLHEVVVDNAWAGGSVRELTDGAAQHAKHLTSAIGQLAVGR